MEERMTCPFCGEAISKNAKKCRYCGEWIDNADLALNNREKQTHSSYQPTAAVGKQSLQSNNPSEKTTLFLNFGGENKPEVIKIVQECTDLDLLEAKNIVDSAPCVIKNGLLLSQATEIKEKLEKAGAEVSLIEERNNPPKSAVTNVPLQIPYSPHHQQPQIVLNVVNNQSVEQNVSQEQAVIVNSANSSDDSFSGGFFLEVLLISGLVWGFVGSWIWGLITFIALMIIYFIPFLGAVLCYVLGAAWGLVIGAIVYAIFKSETAAWIVGILTGLAVGYGHYEAREKDIKNAND